MSFQPCLAWVTTGVRMQLEAYAHACNETPERLAGDLLVEALRARHAPPASWEVPSTAPPLRDADAEAEAMLHELLAHGGCDADAVKAEAIDRRIPWSIVQEAGKALGVRKQRNKGRIAGWRWALPG